ncbi:MAG: hypothetical protein ACOY4M_10220 [Pseudomonadota bacterium]
MNNIRIAAILLATGLSWPLALSAQPAGAMVRIDEPKDGATLDAKAKNELVYGYHPAPPGDHVHAYVDGKQVAILRERKGRYPLKSLTPGMREICVKMVNKAHTPIGVNQCVRVSAH